MFCIHTLRDLLLHEAKATNSDLKILTYRVSFQKRGPRKIVLPIMKWIKEHKPLQTNFYFVSLLSAHDNTWVLSAIKGIGLNIWFLE